jgi:hypothetical protein
MPIEGRPVNYPQEDMHVLKSCLHSNGTCVYTASLEDPIYADVGASDLINVSVIVHTEILNLWIWQPLFVFLESLEEAKLYKSRSTPSFNWGRACKNR